MKRVRIGEFRDRASALIRRAAAGETVVILNRNREVAKIVPITAHVDRTGGLIGSLAGTATITGDIEAPIAPSDAWFRDRP
jgi:prevent-host-death family protein